MTSPDRRCFFEDGEWDEAGKENCASMACRSLASSSPAVNGTRHDGSTKGGSGASDDASGQISSSAWRHKGRVLDCGGWSGGGSDAVLEGEGSHSDSAACKMASRRFLRKRIAADTEEGKEDDDSDEESEEEDE
jgi:hypothetical protein